MAKYGKFKYGQAKYGTDEPLWVTARKQSDLENNTSYAYINYTDLNRIETRIKELATLLNEKGIQNEIVTNVWYSQNENNLTANLPSQSKMINILNNINELYNLIKENFETFALENTLIDTMKFLTIKSMNNLENMLYQMNVFMRGV